MKFIGGFLSVVLCATALSQRPRREDPLCVTQNCRRGTTCRVVKECQWQRDCALTALCLAPREVPTSRPGRVCHVGQPILERRNGRLHELSCYAGKTCPADTYCNHNVQDRLCFCCRSDPDRLVKSGQCPSPSSDRSRNYCVDTCGNDGDCNGNYKCCFTGCSKNCVRPREQPSHAHCDQRSCPPGRYCIRQGMSQVTINGLCYRVGDCAPCPITRCTPRCQYGSIPDSNGCQTCNCRPRATRARCSTSRSRYRTGQPDRSYTRARQPDRSYTRARQPDRSYTRARQPDRSYTRARQPDRSYTRARQPDRSYTRTRQPDRSYTRTRQPDRSYTRARQPDRSYTRTRQPDQSHSRTRQSDQSYTRTRQPDQSHSITRQPDQSHSRTRQPDQSHTRTRQLDQSYPRTRQPDRSYTRTSYG